jgi:Xaa-Pro aminopeptidase
MMARAADHPGPERVQRLAQELSGRDLDALLVESPTDVRYLTGFTGTSGMALLDVAATPEPRGSLRFLTDFRYGTQSAEQLPDAFEREVVSGELLDAAAGALGEEGGRLGFDEAHLTVKAHGRLRELLGERWELVACDGAVARLRSVKEAGEVARIRAAAELADAALLSLLEDGIVGRSERDVALELELRMRRLGAEGPSFPTIVAAGAHAALPHAQPRNQEIPRDALVTIDWGAVHEGYCSDCTRTYATGERISDEAREVYELVLAAQERGLSAAKAGPSGRELDAVARAVIEQAGRGEQFGHGLGHGVGLEVHEAPRLSRTAGTEPLRAGQVVTIEPGIYLPGKLGVRIEDLVVLGEDGPDVLNGLPKELNVVS